MAELVHLPGDAPLDEVLAVLDEDGALVLDAALGADQLASLRDELAPFLTTSRTGNNAFAGYQTKRIGALMARIPAARAVALDARLMGLCEQLLGRFADGHQLHFTQAVSIGPGEAAQALHRDRGVWGGYVPRRIETQLSTIWAISDFTAENGATQVVPGSQHWDKGREPEPHEILRAEMRAGSVLVYTRTVIHGGGANETDDQWRVGLLLHYTLNWLRQEENQYLSCPPDVAQQLSPELRSLMGYSRGNGVLGFYSAPNPADEPGPELADPRKLFVE